MSVYKNYVVSITDDQGDPLIPSSITILTASTQTAATVYSDDELAAFTNPVTAPASSVLSFWSADATVDLKMRTKYGDILSLGITPENCHVQVKRNMNKKQLLYALKDPGVLLVGNVVNQTKSSSCSYTIPANTLKPGDVVHLVAVMHAVAQSGVITQLYTVEYGGNTLAASNAVAVAANDYGLYDLYISIRTATTASATGKYTYTPAAKATAVTKPYWVAEITTDITVATDVNICNTFGAAALAGDTCRCEQFLMEVMRS